MVPSIITLEEHYVSDDIRETIGDAQYADFPKSVMERLINLGDKRLSDMDKGKVNLQIISHGPLDAGPGPCKKANDGLAAACKKSHGRLAGFAMLPMAEPDAAAQELERCVKELGFVGALIDNHLDGVFYDDPKFWPVFAKAEELDVPLYIHPTFAADEWMPHYRGNYPEKAAFMMSMAGFGWHSETALHVLRLWASGLFDKYPKVKIIIGHMGEMLPYQLDRIFGQSARWVDNQRALKTVWNENFWVTTSGMFSLAPLSCLLKMCSMDRILYSVDYPFSTNERGLQFVEDLEKSGMVSKEDLAAICSGNAERLLRVKAN